MSKRQRSRPTTASVPAEKSTDAASLISPDFPWDAALKAAAGDLNYYPLSHCDEEIGYVGCCCYCSCGSLS